MTLKPDTSTPYTLDTFVAPACNETVTILEQDDTIMLINKPSGLLSLSGKNPLNWDSVHYRLVNGQQGVSASYPDAQLPHRLDFGTSGLMVIGLTVIAVKHLNQQFEARTVQKRYQAVLEGWLTEDEGRIDASIAKDRHLFPKVKICHTSGKQAISEYKVLKRLDNPQRTLVEFTPITGRTHQLRIHSHFIGHPILGCDLYQSEHNRSKADRLLLHASELSLNHPETGERLDWICEKEF